MKKLTSLLLITLTVLTMLPGLASCKVEDDAQIKIGYMAGPTGIGMAKIIDDYGGEEATEQYDFIKYADTNSANTDLMNGQLDIACLPTNEAAKFYNTVNPDLVVLAINCLNSLCLLTNDNVTVNSISDLEGKTIYTCKNGTPRIILTKLLEAYGINANVVFELGEGDTATTITTPQDLAPVIVANKADIVLAPEPIVSNALSKPTAKHKVAFDLGEAWDAKFDTPIAMGCIAVRREFLEEHPVAIEAFLERYEDSIEYMSDPTNIDRAAELVIKAGIMADLEPAKSALRNLGDAIEYIDGDDMKETLVNIYNVFGLNVIGGKLPDNNFYYEEKDD